MNPLISIVTVCFNSERTVLDTLTSVAVQEFSNYEHIIWNAGSTDRTAIILQEYNSPQLRIFGNADKGIYDGMNKGLSLTRGDVIGFLNSDDMFADNQVLVRIAEAFQDPEVEACFSDLIYVNEGNSRVVRFWKSKTFSLGSFAVGWSPAHPTFYIRRSALVRLGMFDLAYSLAADTEFMMRYLEVGKVKSIYIPHVQVRMRVGGATNQSWRNILRQNGEIFHALRNNNIPYSTLSFWAHKLANRLWQRLAGKSHQAKR